MEGVEGISSSVPSQDPVAGTTAKSQGADAASYNVDTKISSMAELKEKAPEVHQKMMEGLAMMIVREMESHQDRIRELNRDYQRG